MSTTITNAQPEASQSSPQQVIQASPSTQQLQQQQSSKSNKRLELEKLIREFQNKLGNDWDKYHESLSLFLIGKLSRNELVKTISPILKNGLIKYHNRLLLLNFANSLKDGPLDFQNEIASFWNKKAIKPKNVRSSQYEKFKQNIMGLPIRERRRIKSITKESGKKGKLSASITLTRHSLLPKIPMIQDKEEQQNQVNNLVQWQQDVVNGINTQICTDNYELPDLDNLSRRVLMIMREYGLTGGLNARVLEVISLGLEAHLANIFESAIDVAKYRSNKFSNNDFISTANSIIDEEKKKFSNESNATNNDDIENDNMDIDNPSQGSPKKRKLNEQPKKKETILNIEDLYNTFEMFPHLIEPCGPKLRLSNVMLQNDDTNNNERLPYNLPPKIEPIIDSVATANPNIPGNSNGPSPNTANGVLKKPDSHNENNEKQPEGINSTVKKEEPAMPSKQPSITGNSASRTPQQSDNSHIGTTDELKWVLHDLISTM